jgi:hypothetical protein
MATDPDRRGRQCIVIGFEPLKEITSRDEHALKEFDSFRVYCYSPWHSTCDYFRAFDKIDLVKKGSILDLCYHRIHTKIPPF